jgi:hypothetical protein
MGGRLGGQIRAHRADFSIQDQDICHGIEPLRGVHHTSTRYEQGIHQAGEYREKD